MGNSYIPRNLGQTKIFSLQTKKNLTGSYANFGDKINAEGYKYIGIFIDTDVNDSENVTIQVKGAKTSTATNLYDIDGLSEKTLWTTSASNDYLYYEFEIGNVPFIQLQAKAGNTGVTAGYLTGGTNAESTFGTWEAVTDAEFAITIDGTAYDITGIDFTGVTDMDDVASVLQAAIRAETGSEETVVWSTDHFIITSSTLGSTSEVSVASTISGGSGTDISGAGASDWLDADVVGGTATAGTGTIGALTVEYNLKY